MCRNTWDPDNLRKAYPLPSFQHWYPSCSCPRSLRISSVSSFFPSPAPVASPSGNAISPPIHKLYFESYIKCLSTEIKNRLMAGKKKIILLLPEVMLLQRKPGQQSRKLPRRKEVGGNHLPLGHPWLHRVALSSQEPLVTCSWSETGPSVRWAVELQSLHQILKTLYKT